MAKRGCGYRIEGGLYLCCGMSLFGQPIEEFLVDPSMLTDLQPSRAPQLVEHTGGIYHVVIWVGEAFYPLVPDFIEEARKLGISRRVPKGFDFSKLGPQSRMILAHRKAGVANFEELRELLAQPPELNCPRGLVRHNETQEFCVMDLWRLAGLEGTERAVGDISYKVNCPEGDWPEPVYLPAFFATFPIASIDYVKVDGQVERKVAEHLSGVALPVRYCDEQRRM